jgi:hypothetical protein
MREPESKFPVLPKFMPGAYRNVTGNALHSSWHLEGTDRLGERGF